MRYTRQLACALFGAVLFVGCEKSEPTSSAPPAKPAPNATDSTAQGTASTAAESGQNAVTNMKDMANASKDKLNAGADAVVGSTSSAGGAAAPSVTTTGPANSAVSADTTEAQKLLDQAMQYIKDNKLNDADTVLTKLEAMKPKLPAEWASIIDSARSAFNSAKAGSDKLKSLVPGGAK